MLVKGAPGYKVRYAVVKQFSSSLQQANTYTYIHTYPQTQIIITMCTIGLRLAFGQTKSRKNYSCIIASPVNSLAPDRFGSDF